MQQEYCGFHQSACGRRGLSFYGSILTGLVYRRSELKIGGLSWRGESRTVGFTLYKNRQVIVSCTVNAWSSLPRNCVDYKGNVVAASVDCLNSLSYNNEQVSVQWFQQVVDSRCRCWTVGYNSECTVSSAEEQI